MGHAPRPLRFVNSLGLGDPPTFDPIQRRLDGHPGVRFKIDAVPAWTPELIDQVAATGAVEIIDFKGQYGMEYGELADLLAMYERVIAAFPDALLEDAHDLPEVAELLAPEAHRISYDAPIHTVEDLDATPLKPVAVNIKPCRVGDLRSLIAVHDETQKRGLGHLRRRDGRDRRRPRPDPAAGLAVPRRRAERHRAQRLQRRHAVGRPAGQPTRRHAGADRLPRTLTAPSTRLRSLRRAAQRAVWDSPQSGDTLSRSAGTWRRHRADALLDVLGWFRHRTT